MSRCSCRRECHRCDAYAPPGTEKDMLRWCGGCNKPPCAVCVENLPGGDGGREALPAWGTGTVQGDHDLYMILRRLFNPSRSSPPSVADLILDDAAEHLWHGYCRMRQYAQNRAQLGDVPGAMEWAKCAATLFRAVECLVEV